MDKMLVILKSDPTHVLLTNKAFEANNDFCKSSGTREFDHKNRYIETIMI